MVFNCLYKIQLGIKHIFKYLKNISRKIESTKAIYFNNKKIMLKITIVFIDEYKITAKLNINFPNNIESCSIIFK